MIGLAGPFLIAAAIVALGGAAKLVAPASTSRALSGLGLPSHPWTVRAIGSAELALGVAAAALGGRVLASMLALAYVSFALFVVAALRQGDAVRSCGCFGSAATPPSVLHVGVNLTAAGVAVAAAVGGVPPLADVLGDQPLAGLPFLALAALGTYLVYASLTVLPQVLDRRPAAAVPTFSVTEVLR